MKRLSGNFFALCATVATFCICVHLSFAGESTYRDNRLVTFNSFSATSLSVPSLPDPVKHPGDIENNAVPAVAPTVFDRIVLTEDTTLQGRVLVRGYLVVAPQATLRIEPGTVVMFEGSSGINKQDTQLVIQGRISAVGTASSPILLTSDRSRPSRGDWGGISFVSTEKRNQMEHCRIEYAKYGIHAQFSSISLKMVSVLNSSSALLTRDAFIQISGGAFSESDYGIDMSDSELDAKDVIINSNSHGLHIMRTAANLSNISIKDNRQLGIIAEVSRIKISSGEISGNAVGARIDGGEGQITGTVFKNNRDTALHVSGARIKVSRNIFVKNKQDAIRTGDGRVLIWGNSFSANSGYNINNTGTENVVALLNWWESTDPAEILLKIFDSARDPRLGSVRYHPWLNEKPPYVQ